MINEEALNDITPTNDKKTFAYYRRGRAGKFATMLLDAWRVADTNNQYRLSVAFPELAKAIREYNESENREEYIKNILKEDS